MTRCLLAWTAACLALPAATALAASRPVSLRAADGTALAAAVYDAPALPAPAVVLVHMFTRTKEDWRDVAERLQAGGITALALDLRGHGGSAGAPAPAAAMGLDVQAAVAWLTARADVKSVAAIGASLGATAAALAAAEIPAVRGLALLSPAADYRGVRLEAALRKYGARPLLLVASAEDPYALRTVNAFMENAPATHEQRVSAVAGHGTGLLAKDPAIVDALVDWLRRTLIF